MASNDVLRNNHRKLLDKLKKSQEHISKLIVASKHSDHRVLAHPLTSTVLGIDEKNPLKESQMLIDKANQCLRNNINQVEFEVPHFSGSSTLKQDNTSAPKSSKTNKSQKPSKQHVIVAEASKVNVEDNSGKQKTLRFVKNKQTKLLECDDNRRPYNDMEDVQKQRPARSILKTPVPSGLAAAEEQDDECLDKLGGGDNNMLGQQKSNSNSENSTTTKLQQETSSARDPRPLLGYDWIAGVMDNESLARPSGSAVDLSDEAINDIMEFRRTHRKECHSASKWQELMRTPKTPKTPKTPFDSLPKVPNQVEKSPDPDNIYDPRIVNYTINKRLFPVSVNPHHSQRPGSRKSPRYVRVSIPKVALASPHRYEAKRKGAYSGGADSLALPEHCVMGWQQNVRNGNKSAKIPQKMEEDAAGLDLRSSIRPRDVLTKLQINAGQFPDHGCWTAEDDYKKSYLHQSSQNLLDQSYAVQLAHQKLRNDCKYS